MLARYMLSLCVRLSVRPSVCNTPVLITQTKPYDSLGTLVFFDAKDVAKFQLGRQIEVGSVQIGDFRPIGLSCYISEMMQYRDIVTKER